MIYHSHISNKLLHSALKTKEITYGGNAKLKIYGTLHCKSGKRIKKENRVFFTSEEEALKEGYRPCGHCLRTLYQNWKNGSVR